VITPRKTIDANANACFGGTAPPQQHAPLGLGETRAMVNTAAIARSFPSAPEPAVEQQDQQ
jgi:hypothetical protein